MFKNEKEILRLNSAGEMNGKDEAAAAATIAAFRVNYPFHSMVYINRNFIQICLFCTVFMCVVVHVLYKFTCIK